MRSNVSFFADGTFVYCPVLVSFSLFIFWPSTSYMQKRTIGLFLVSFHYWNQRMESEMRSCFFSKSTVHFKWADVFSSVLLTILSKIFTKLQGQCLPMCKLKDACSFQNKVVWKQSTNLDFSPKTRPKNMMLASWWKIVFLLHFLPPFDVEDVFAYYLMSKKKNRWWTSGQICRPFVEYSYCTDISVPSNNLVNFWSGS